LDVNLKPGDTTFYHLHATPSVFIFFTKTKTGSQIFNGAASSDVSSKNSINYDELTTPRIHRVWNEDTSWFHVIDVEIVSKEAKTEGKPLNNNNKIELLFDKALVRGYKLSLKGGETFALSKWNTRFLLISLDEGQISILIDSKKQERKMQAGHFMWIEAGEHFLLKNSNISATNFALLELK
jgi:hypothetical protein